MIRFALATTLIVLYQLAVADESWIEGRWVASRSHTFDELSHGDPSLRSAMEELVEEIDRVWIFDSGTARFIDFGKEMGPVNYFIRPIEEGVFEMIFDEPDGEQNYMIIHRRSFGFCYRYGGDYSADPAPEQQECYVRDDA